MDATDTPSPPRPPLSLLLILGALTAFAPMSIDMYLPALPRIAHDLGSTATGAQATVAAFFAGLSVGQLLYGPLSDRRGRRGPLLAGLSLYVVASVLCAAASTMPLLIAARVLQALGGCAGVIIARAVVRDRFDHTESARIFSTLMLIMGVAPVLAPLAGGAVLTHVGWRAIFGLLAVFGLLVGAAVWRGLPESRSDATAERARSESPLRAYLALVSQPRLVAYALAGGLSSAAMFTYITASPGLVIETYHVPADQFGWVFGTNAVGIIGASQFNRLLLRRLSPDAVLRLSTAFAAVAAAVLVVTSYHGALGLPGILLPLFFVIAAGGLTGPNAVAGALSQDTHRAGSVAALVGASQFALGACGAVAAGLFHDGSARPMAIIIAVCIVASVLATRAATRRLPSFPGLQASPLVATGEVTLGRASGSAAPAARCPKGTRWRQPLGAPTWGRSMTGGRPPHFHASIERLEIEAPSRFAPECPLGTECSCPSTERSFRAPKITSPASGPCWRRWGSCPWPFCSATTRGAGVVSVRLAPRSRGLAPPVPRGPTIPGSGAKNETETGAEAGNEPRGRERERERERGRTPCTRPGTDQIEADKQSNGQKNRASASLSAPNSVFGLVRVRVPVPGLGLAPGLGSGPGLRGTRRAHHAMEFPAPFEPAFLADLPYDPEVLFLDRIESLDREKSQVVCRMPTDVPLPLTLSQRAHDVRHPRHVAGGLMVHITGMLGFVHAYHLEGLRHADGWVGYGTHIQKATFRKLVPPGLPMVCACTQVKIRRGKDRFFSTYRFTFHHEGELAYESEQSAMWVRPEARAAR